MKIRIGITDDQQLFLKSLVNLVNTFPDFQVVLEAGNGLDLLNQLENMEHPPEILIIDVNMPVLDGPETVKRISAGWPQVKTVALSMKDDDLSVISMLKAGACAYLLKDVNPSELQTALKEISATGCYNADAISLNYRRLLRSAGLQQDLNLNDREKDFLQLACSDLPYKAIAAKMFLSEKTIDGYRNSVFQKLNVKSRVGMVIEAMKKNLVDINKAI